MSTDDKYGQAKTYLGSTVATTDGAGNATFNALLKPAPAGW